MLKGVTKTVRFALRDCDWHAVLCPSYWLQMRPPPVQGGNEDCEVCSLRLRLARSPVLFLLIQREGHKRGESSRPRTLTRRVAHNGGGCVCSPFLTPVPERGPHCDPQQVCKIDAPTVGGQILCSLFGPSGGPKSGPTCWSQH